MAEYSLLSKKHKDAMHLDLEKRKSLRFRIVMVILIVFSISNFLQSDGAINVQAGKNVFINQAGYLPGEIKRVVVDRSAKGFTVVEEKTGKKVFAAKLKSIKDNTTKKKIWAGNFTPLSRPGKYRIKVTGVGDSYSFVIDPNIYTQVLNLAMRSFYLQRCGIILNDEETGLTHPRCHKNDGVTARKDNYYEAGQPLPCMGGWHDAGDYGKYTTTTTIAVAHMLVAYELWSEKFSDGQFRIPESGNGVPDILDESRIGLEWLLTMQRPDGAVYHKLAGSRWPSFVSPDDEHQTRFIYGISTADTGKFAATMAIAARVWKNIDLPFANRVSLAALKAWRFLANNEYIWDHLDLDDDGSGAYGKTDDLAERIWAGLELSTITDTGHPIKEWTTQLDSYQLADIGWEDPAALGFFNYTRSPYALPEIKGITEGKIIDLAEKNLKSAMSSGYRYTLNFSEFQWASNKQGLSRGIAMLLADQLRAKPEYRQNALTQLDFVLGLNPLSKCFVTGLGSDPPLNLHHRLAIATGKIIPGLLAGGPNNKGESGVEPLAKGPYSYVDGSQSYSSNEPAIDYNAALIFAAAAFAANGK